MKSRLVSPARRCSPPSVRPSAVRGHRRARQRPTVRHPRTPATPGTARWPRARTARTSGSCRSGSPATPATARSLGARRRFGPATKAAVHPLPAGVRPGRRRRRRPGDLRQDLRAPGRRLHAGQLHLRRAEQLQLRLVRRQRRRRHGHAPTRWSPCGSCRPCGTPWATRRSRVNGGFRSSRLQQRGRRRGQQPPHSTATRSTSAPARSASARLAQQARNHGFREILGPGYPDHDDHTHVADRADRFWSAPDCGI